jgi:hypothetical protein
MAKKQTRRSVSINRANYEAAKQEAARRGLPLAGLVESALAAFGVACVEHVQQPVATVQASIERRTESMAARSARQSSPGQPTMHQPVRGPSRERQMLGDQAADAYGFQ